MKLGDISIKCDRKTFVYAQEFLINHGYVWNDHCEKGAVTIEHIIGEYKIRGFNVHSELNENVFYFNTLNNKYFFYRFEPFYDNVMDISRKLKIKKLL